MKKIIEKIRRRLTKLSLQPIRVYCLHHVCEHFDPDSMHESDWMALGEFQQRIFSMHKDSVQFISLTDAYNHIKNDKVRLGKYAVLTFDDGYASLKELLPEGNDLKAVEGLLGNSDNLRQESREVDQHKPEQMTFDFGSDFNNDFK